MKFTYSAARERRFWQSSLRMSTFVIFKVKKNKTKCIIYYNYLLLSAL